MHQVDLANLMFIDVKIARNIIILDFRLLEFSSLLDFSHFRNKL